MREQQSLRAFTFLGSAIIGIWLPLQLLGHLTSFPFEIAFSMLISLVSISSVYLYFKELGGSAKKLSNWLNVGLIADLFCAIPFELVYTINQKDLPILLILLNMSCVRHVSQIKKFLDYFDQLSPMAYRLIPIFFTLPLLVHAAACGWIALGSGTAGESPDRLTTYIKALYWAITTFTTVGYGDISAKSNGQMIYTCGVELAGVGVFGFILSNVASLIGRSDAAREHHMDNLDKIETFMGLHQIPEKIRSNTRSYYHYLWHHKKGYQDRSLLQDLPHKLQSELLFHINKPIIEKVPFLKGASHDMLESLMEKLEPRIYLPGEKIFKIDEPGDALYFIHSGEVEILARDQAPIAQLRDGAFFGEMALLNDRPRSATVQSLGFCDLYLLHKKSFDEVIQAYPDFKEHLYNAMNQRKAA